MNTTTPHNNRTKQIIIGLALAAAAMLTQPAMAASPALINLNSCNTFAILASSAVSTTGSGIINGDVGLFPAGSQGIPPAQVNGNIYNGGPIAQQAQADLTIAYNDAQGRSLNRITLTDGENIGGQTLAPGLYWSASSLEITGDLTLDAGGDPNAVWIFQMGSTLTTAAGGAGDPHSRVILAGSAQARNIFWQVGSSATLGTYSIFKGTILAQASISMDTDSIMDGRALARAGAVTFNGVSGSLPATDTPFVRITNQPPHLVSNSVTTVYLAGTNNLSVVGAMYRRNHTTGADGPLTRTASSNTWFGTVSGLAVGANHIHVHGTNVYGQVAFDDVTVVRLDAGPTPPYIDITNGPDIFVTYDFTSATFGGTNDNVVGVMWWSNVTTSAGGAMAATDAWSLTVGGLAVCVNEFYVYGTNRYGAFASEFVDIVRRSTGTGLPFVDVTSTTQVADITVPFAATGTNNLHVVGTMWVSNAANGQQLGFAAAPAWVAAAVDLEFLTNTIYVFGSNLLGNVTNDTMVVIGVPEGVSLLGLTALTMLVARRRLRA